MNRCVLVVAAGCSLCGVAAADILYSTGFDGFSLGTINNQFGWSVLGGPESHGVIVDESGNQFLKIASPRTWGSVVARSYDAAASKRYVQVVMDFCVDNDQWPFWYLDNHPAESTPPDAIFWAQESAWAADGSRVMPIFAGKWAKIGIEVDTQLRGVIGVNFDGVWYPETDASISPPGALLKFNFQGKHFDQDHPDAIFWLSIDNIGVTDSDQPIVPSPGVLCLLGLALLRQRR